MTYEYRGFLIGNAGSSVLKEIKPVGKGSVVNELRGLYTTGREAEKAIDRVLTLKESSGGKKPKRSGDNNL